MAFSGILGVGPMAIYRLLEGDYIVAAVDALAVIGFFAIAWLVYVKRSIRIGSVLMAIVAMGATVASVNLRGGSQIIWMHPALVAMFYLLRPKEAAVASIIAIVAVSPTVFDGREMGQVAIILASLAVTVSLSVAFAALTAEQRRELHATTLRDPLTGTGNRRALDESLDEAIVRAKDPQQAFFLIMLDIDHFKSVNDLHGHAVGDAVLKDVAETINGNIRPTDSCFRAGGEEFVVLAATPDLTQAKRLGERLRSAIESMTPATGNGGTLSVTASLGLAEYLNGESRDALYKRADDALYEAKRSGRNRLQLSRRLSQTSAA
ncbi:MAG: GGDEF domain-containing protein [Pseudomonadota bacterium]